MHDNSQQHVAVHLSGQDDNLGDSALRDGLLAALRGRGRKMHIFVRDVSGVDQTSDYMSGLRLAPTDVIHTSRASWLASCPDDVRPVHVFNAGEINPRGRTFPVASRARELKAVQTRGGVVIASGIGVKNPQELDDVNFYPAFREADIVSWRDYGSQEAAGFGEVNPDWAFSLGNDTSSWVTMEQRELLIVTLRFDRPYPDRGWLESVRRLARITDTRIVTLAQVGRDAPRAVRLADDLGAEYAGAPSFDHAVLSDHVRKLFSKALLVVSDRAHGLIIGASEGAYPVGSGSDPQKICRLLDTVGLGQLTGSYDEIEHFVDQVPDQLENLAPAIDSARSKLNQLTVRIQALLGSIEP